MIRNKVLILILLLTLFSSVHAQSSSMDAYFLAPDENGVIQVWHWGESLEIITAATHSIDAYGVSHDGLSVAYASDGKLWLHQGTEAFVIAEDADQGFLLFSPDDQNLIYTHYGVWIYKMDGSAEPRQLIANIRSDTYPPSDVTILRDYYPREFTPDGKWLTLVIGLWEHTKVGVLNLETEEVFEVESSYAFNRIQVLADGQVALYSYNEQYTSPDIEITTPDNFYETTSLMDLYDSLPDIAIVQFVEIEPDMLRVLSLDTVNDSAVILDYDRTNNALIGEMHTIPLPISDEGKTIIGTLSPDGNLLSIYVNAVKSPTYDAKSIPTGEIMIYDLTTGEWSSLPEVDQLTMFIWR